MDDGQQTKSLEDRIISAARELFFQKGYFPTKTREIAKKAGTSESGIFRLFENKFVLLMAVYNFCWRRVNEHIEKCVTKSGDPRERLLNVLRSLWELYEIDPLMMAFIMSNFGSADTLLISREEEAIITDEGGKYIGLIEGLCKECVQVGLIDKRITVAALREHVFGLAESVLVGWYLADRNPGGYPEKVAVKEALLPLMIILYGTS